MVLAVLLGACAANKFGSGGWQGTPDKRLDFTPPESAHCADLSASYANAGYGYVAGDDQLLEARLDAVLGFPFPTERMPHRVLVADSQGGQTIRVNFMAETSQAVDLETECVDGWRRVRMERSDAYLGDGVQLQSSVQTVLLARAADGSLITQQHSEEVYRTGFIFRSRVVKEAWFRFVEID